MPTKHQISTTEKAIREYRKRYLKSEFSDVDESATRIMVNTFLTEVLGYKELEEIKTEHRIKGQYADYMIQLKRKNQIVVEVKSIQIDLDRKHLRQSVNYAANEGVDWVLLFNGRNIELYRVLFEKPIQSKKLFSHDLKDLKTIKRASEDIANLTKQAVAKGALEDFWARCRALKNESVAKLLFSEEVARYVRREVKKDTGIYLDIEEIADSIDKVISEENNFKLKYRKKK